MGDITYTHGDATDPAGPGPRIIAHICNDEGGWGRGFVLALGRRFPEAETAYRLWSRGEGLWRSTPFALGELELVPVREEIWVANMVAQHGTRTSPEGIPPIRYEALAQCLRTLSREARALGATIHMPRMGCGLAGGRWSEIEPIIVAELCSTNIPVTVYDYDGPGPEVVGWQK